VRSLSGKKRSGTVGREEKTSCRKREKSLDMQLRAEKLRQPFAISEQLPLIWYDFMFTCI